MTTIVLDPITRLEGHLKVDVTLDSNNNVIDAKAAGNLFRDFENMLANRIPRDAAYLTQRICGICPVSHAVASAKAVENAIGFKPNLQALLLRNLVLGADHIASNLLHFYHLSLMDFIQGPQMSPWSPGYSQDLRFSSADTQTLTNNYITALTIRRKAHEMGAIFGGKLPHAASIVAGGVTAIPSSINISTFKTYLNDIQAFINNQYQADVNKLAATYSDYYNIGKGYGNLISYGVFEKDTSGNTLFPAGTVANGTISSFNAANIKEYNKYSWYSSASGQNPNVGTTTADFGKTGAYTWLKAPRYSDVPYEAGPLARTWVSGDYRNGTSVMDRIMARYTETAKIAANMQTWINQIVANGSAYTDLGTPASGSGIGLTEAPRGALGHWISITNSKISKYQIITPTCWNASPKDDNGNSGPIEKALIGAHVANSAEPVELIRIVHSFDPCTGCSVHVISPEGIEMSKFIVNPMGE